MTKRTAIAVAAVIAFAGSVQAQDMGSPSVGVGVTNFGLSLEGEYTISPQVGARAMLMGGFSFEDEFEVDEATVDGEATFGGFAVVADYYPFANPFRVSGGLFFSNSEITGTVSDLGLTYEGEIALANEVAPLLTTGFKREVAAGWSISSDAGVIISSLEVSSDDPAAADDVDDLNAELENIPVVPFVSFAVSYSF